MTMVKKEEYKARQTATLLRSQLPCHILWANQFKTPHASQLKLRQWWADVLYLLSVCVYIVYNSNGSSDKEIPGSLRFLHQRFWCFSERVRWNFRYVLIIAITGLISAIISCNKVRCQLINSGSGWILAKNTHYTQGQMNHTSFWVFQRAHSCAIPELLCGTLENDKAKEYSKRARLHGFYMYPWIQMIVI